MQARLAEMKQPANKKWVRYLTDRPLRPVQESYRKAEVDWDHTRAHPSYGDHSIWDDYQKNPDHPDWKVYHGYIPQCRVLATLESQTHSNSHCHWEGRWDDHE